MKNKFLALILILIFTQSNQAITKKQFLGACAVITGLCIAQKNGPEVCDMRTKECYRKKEFNFISLPFFLGGLFLILKK